MANLDREPGPKPHSPPRLTRLDPWLLKVAAGSVLVAMLSVLWLISSSRPNPQYTKGESFPMLPNVDFRANQITLVMWIDPRCHVCNDSMPFYREILAARRSARVVAVSRDPIETLKEYLDTFRVQPDQIVSVGELPFTFRGTPTLVLVDGKARVKSIWTGLVPRETQGKEVMVSIR